MGSESLLGPTHLVVTLTSQLDQLRNEHAWRGCGNDALLPEFSHLFLDLLDETRVVRRGDQKLGPGHGLVLPESLLNLGDSLVDCLLVFEQLLADLGVWVGVQTFPYLCHALLEIGQGEVGDGRDGDVGGCVARLQVDDVVQVAHALLDLSLGEAAGRAHLPERDCTIRDHDGDAGLVDTLVPVATCVGFLGQPGCALSLEQLVHLGRALALLGMCVLLLRPIPVSRLCLDLGQLHVGPLETGPELEALLEVVGGLGGAADGELGGRALEVGQVVVGVSGHGGVVVYEGVARLPPGEVLLGGAEKGGDGSVGGYVLGRQGGHHGDGGR